MVCEAELMNASYFKYVTVRTPIRHQSVRIKSKEITSSFMHFHAFNSLLIVKHMKHLNTQNSNLILHGKEL